MGGSPMKALLAVILTMVLTGSAFAHGGGLDRNGCHTDRKTGDRHCHR
ncbi:YHYH domain-containing protein [Microvirga zambiensis]